MTALASFSLIGFAGVTTAAAISAAAAGPDIRQEGRMRMVEAQYRLACLIGR